MGTAIREEVAGTYKDFMSALHQVGNAFVIGPDDIDRVADKIRDAKIEMGENYDRQVQEGSAPASTSTRGGSVKQQQNRKKGSKQTKQQPAPGNKAVQLEL